MAEKFHFECVDCKAEYSGEKVMYLCPACETSNTHGKPPKGVLKTIYRYDHILSQVTGDSPFRWLAGQNFLPLLPIRDLDPMPGLRVGETPLYQVDPEGRPDTGFTVYVKDDSQNPTFSFKDRASALVSAWAKEHGLKTLVTASTGNAGSSLAGICASQGQRAMIVVPATAPLAKLTQILMYGAVLLPVKGTYDDAFDLSVKISGKYGFYNRNTAYNPLTIEGKKTVSYEIFGQLHQQVPNRIFIPVGDGVIYSGVCKGFEDMMQLGIIDRMPVLVAVQADGSSNLINNYKRDTFVATPSKTIADSISVDVPRCFNMTAAFMDQYNGESVSVSDQEILGASVQLSHATGIFTEPAAAAAFAGMLKYKKNGMIPSGSTNVVLLTGSGLKDLPAVQTSIHIPEPFGPDIPSTEAYINKHFSFIS